MLNSIVPRRCWRTSRRAYGSVFASIAPDHCFSYRCLDRVDSILHWDRPLIIQRGLWRSNGFSQIRGVSNADHADFLRELATAASTSTRPCRSCSRSRTRSTTSTSSCAGSPPRRSCAAAPSLLPGRERARREPLEDPELRARMQQVLVRARLVDADAAPLRARALSSSAAGYYWRHPRALVRRLLRRAAAPPRVRRLRRRRWPTRWSTRARRRGADHLWPLMSRPGATRERRADAQRRRAAPASRTTNRPPHSRTNASCSMISSFRFHGRMNTRSGRSRGWRRASGSGCACRAGSGPACAG